MTFYIFAKVTNFGRSFTTDYLLAVFDSKGSKAFLPNLKSTFFTFFNINLKQVATHIQFFFSKISIHKRLQFDTLVLLFYFYF